jgi:hypothetical protein
VKEHTVDSYIVRVYRRGATRLRRIVGVVEEVGIEGTRSFADLDSLWQILSSRRPVRTRADRGPKRSTKT